MTNCMAGAVQQVERPVPEVIECWELADAEGIGPIKADFP